jgi:hypothetical protein
MQLNSHQAAAPIIRIQVSFRTLQPLTSAVWIKGTARQFVPLFRGDF